MFATDQVIKDRHIGAGDEVFITGLFTRLEGASRNIPIVRIGNVAMLPDSGDTVTADFGGQICETEAYLVEARSIGGVSGSPVFVRETVMEKAKVVPMQTPSAKPRETVAHMAGEFHLLGLMHGHWEIIPTRKKDPTIKHIKNPETVNLGIAIVVPAKKILETINHPELVEMRRRQDEQLKQSMGLTTPD